MGSVPSRLDFDAHAIVKGLLDPAAVTPILDRHVSGREDLSRQIWGLMALTLWFDRYAN